MPRPKKLRGETTRYDEPNWWPLRELVGRRLADWFMWMGEIKLSDDTAVHAYKHIATRRYVHLGEDGRAFAYTEDDRYVEMRRGTAVAGVFSGWTEIAPQPEDPKAAWDAISRALERAWDDERAIEEPATHPADLRTRMWEDSGAEVVRSGDDGQERS